MTASSSQAERKIQNGNQLTGSADPWQTGEVTWPDVQSVKVPRSMPRKYVLPLAPPLMFSAILPLRQDLGCIAQACP